MSIRNALLDAVEWFGSIIICWLGFVLVAISLYRFVGESVSLAFVALIAGGASLWLHRKTTNAIGLVYAFTVIGVLILLMFPLDYIWDTSWDSLAFHMPAIKAIIEGWNPTRHTHDIIWVSTYPNGWWTLQATMVSLLKPLGLSMESARLLNMLIMPATIGLGLSTLRVLGQLHPISILLLIAALANPITANQMLTFMQDGSLYLLCLCLGFGLIKYLYTGETLALLVMLCSLALVIATKMSGIYWAFTICAMVFLTYILSAPRIPLRSMLICLGATICVILLVCYRPIVTNMLDYGSVLYPPPDSHIMVVEGLQSWSAPLRFIGVIAAQKDLAFADAVKWIYPWGFTLSDFRYMGTSSVSYGGFSPAFLLISALAMCVYFITICSSQKRLFLLVPAIILALCMAAFPANWLARYIPLLWLLPIMLMLPTVAMSSRTIKAVVTTIALGMIVCGAITFYYALTTQHSEYHMTWAKVADRDKLLLLPDPSTERNQAYAIWQARLSAREIAVTIAADCEVKEMLPAGVGICE